MGYRELTSSSRNSDADIFNMKTVVRIIANVWLCCVLLPPLPSSDSWLSLPSSGFIIFCCHPFSPKASLRINVSRWEDCHLFGCKPFYCSLPLHWYSSWVGNYAMAVAFCRILIAEAHWGTASAAARNLLVVISSTWSDSSLVDFKGSYLPVMACKLSHFHYVEKRVLFS